MAAEDKKKRQLIRVFPIMNSMNAALLKIGIITRMHIEPQPETRGTRFTLTKV